MYDDFEETCECGGTFRFSVDDVAKERSVRCSGGCDVHLTDSGVGRPRRRAHSATWTRP